VFLKMARLLAVASALAAAAAATQPLVINTWFPNATEVAYNMLTQNYTALDSVEAGVTYCEGAQCKWIRAWPSAPRPVFHRMRVSPVVSSRACVA